MGSNSFTERLAQETRRCFSCYTDFPIHLECLVYFVRLSDRYHLVASDYPGFGHSNWRDAKMFPIRELDNWLQAEREALTESGFRHEQGQVRSPRGQNWGRKLAKNDPSTPG